MRAVMAYMASRGGNRNDDNEMRRGGNRNEYGESRGNYDEMRRDGNRNEYGEMRRGGTRNAYDEPNEDYNEAESRYRGRDGRWKAGRRRSEMNYSMDDEWPEDARAYEARNEYRPRTDNYGRAESRYKPDYPIAPKDERGMPENRRIGFGNNRTYESRSTGSYRFAHCEDLRAAHLPYLKEAGVTEYQPSLSNSLTPALIKATTDIPFDWMLQSWDIVKMSDEEIHAWIADTLAAGATSLTTQFDAYNWTEGKMDRTQVFFDAIEKYRVE